MAEGTYVKIRKNRAPNDNPNGKHQELTVTRKEWEAMKAKGFGYSLIGEVPTPTKKPEPLPLQRESNTTAPATGPQKTVSGPSEAK